MMAERGGKLRQQKQLDSISPCHPTPILTKKIFSINAGIKNNTRAMRGYVGGAGREFEDDGRAWW